MRCTSVALLVFLLPSLASAGPALDKPAFTATPAELLAEAKKAPPSDTGAVILREDVDISFDDKGRATQRERYVVLITSVDATEDWESIYRQWRPWNQDRPTLRARVIAPSGQATEIDPNKISDEPNTVGDTRQVSVELPRVLGAGAVIEEEITIADREPYPGGRVMQRSLVEEEPVSSSRITLSAPSALKARVVERAMPPGLKLRHAVSGGRDTWTLVTGALPVVPFEPSVPEGVARWPFFAIATNGSWATTARAYTALVEPKLGVTLPSGLPHGDTLEVARAITSWMHQHVRFTDADLDQAPLDAVDISAALKRGTAGANEMGALLVALLRAAGIHADLVLVDRGPANEAENDLPWLGAFAHVLVRARVAGAETWIDPEDSAAAIGQLRAEDQDRLALSVADAAVIRTPRAPATANTIREVRTYELSEKSYGRVTEVSTHSGVFEAARRHWLADRNPGDVREQLTHYARNEYRGDLESYSTTATDDLTKPVETTVKVDNSKRATTSWDRIDVYLFQSDTFDHLPWVLASDKRERKLDLAIDTPHVYEIEHRIVVPTGYTIPDPIAEQKRDLGAVHFTQRQRLDGSTLIVTFRMELDKARLSAAEVNETRRAVQDVRNENVHLVFPHHAWSLVEHGKFRQGLAEMDRLIKLHPREAVHHEQLAQLLLKIGDGDGARREARKAVELEPKDADAHVVLGYVLTYDLVGRRWAPGHDHAGARAELVKARALAPKHVGAAVELATLLERDDRGRRFEAGADMRGATEQWRAVNDADPSDDHATAVARSLLWSGDGAGAEKFLQKRPASATRDAMLVAAIALGRGSAAAVRDVPGADRKTTLQSAASFLMMLRQYDAARALITEAGGPPAGTQPGVVEQLKRFDTAFVPTADPKDLSSELALDELDPSRAIRIAWDADTAHEVREELSKIDVPRSEVLTTAVLFDIVGSTTKTRVDGDSSAWRIELDEMGKKDVLYAAADRGVPKMIGIPTAPEGVGRHLFRLIGKNDSAAARLLDWVVKDAGHHELAAVWAPTLPRDRAAMTLAAALLSDDPVHMIAAGTKCGVSTAQGQLVCDMMVARGYHRRRMWAELDAFAAAWASRVPSYAAAWPPYFRASALIQEARFEDAAHVLDEVIPKYGDHPELRWLRAAVAARLGKTQEVIDQSEESVKANPGDPHVLNNAAWLKLAYGIDLAGGLAQARQSVQLDGKTTYTLNTLAALEAETDDLGAAITDIHKAIDLSHADSPPPEDWYVVGRVLEKSGLDEDAIAAYKRALAPHAADEVPNTAELAAGRLKALGVKK